MWNVTVSNLVEERRRLVNEKSVDSRNRALFKALCTFLKLL